MPTTRHETSGSIYYIHAANEERTPIGVTIYHPSQRIVFHVEHNCPESVTAMVAELNERGYTLGTLLQMFEEWQGEITCFR